MNQLFTMLSIVLHKQLVKAIGLLLLWSEDSLPGFGIATMVASLQEGGKIPDSQMKKQQAAGLINFLEG